MNVAGKRVVIVGDSLSSGSVSPGGVLGRELGKAGAAVKINAKVGRSAWSLYNREDHAAQLADIANWSPDIAIVMLGTNDASHSLSAGRQHMVTLRNELARQGQTKVWGIGPPTFAEPRLDAASDQIARMMRDVFRDGFIDWRPLSDASGRSADRVHFTAAGGEVAGRALGHTFLRSTGAQPLVPILLAGLLFVGYLLARRHSGERLR